VSCTDFFKSKNTSKKLKSRLKNTTINKTLTHASETGTLTKRERKHYSIIYNKPTRCNSDSIVFIKNYKYALHVSGALGVHLQEHYKL